MDDWLLVLTSGAGLLLSAIAFPLMRRRVPPNWLYGLRVPSTFADEWVWYEANAKSGRDLLCLGLLLAILPLGLSFSGLGATVLIAWAVIATAGAIGLGIVGWWRANALLRKRQVGNLNRT